MSLDCHSPKPASLIQIGGGDGPKYWRSLKELQSGAQPTGEFPGGLPGPGESAASGSRRDFLSLMGFSLAAAGLTGCRAPVQHAVPMLTAAEEITPGVANFYATTCRGCASACSLVVKQRDGRPIKIEGNELSSRFGGTCATGQATVLSLYDSERLRGPLWKGKAVQWAEMDARITKGLRAAADSKRKIVLLSGTLPGPSTRRLVSEWGQRFPNFQHVTYDAISLSAIRAANAESFGLPAIPSYAFDKARVIVSLDADFLGTWLSPVEFARQYAHARRPEGDVPVHVQFESGLSITGSAADARFPVAPSEMGAVAVALLRRVAQKAGAASVPGEPASLPHAAAIDAVAEQLWRHRGKSLIVSGVQDKPVQLVVNALNAMLGNIGTTLDFARPSKQKEGDEHELATLIEEMARGEVHTLMLYGVNPVYNYSDAARFLANLAKVELAVSFADRRDETSSVAHAICPDHHFLESWGDAEPVASSFSLAQPVMAPLFDTRAAQDSLLRWMGSTQDHYTYLRGFWQSEIFPRQNQSENLPRQNEPAGFDAFWDRTLQAGVLELAPVSQTHTPPFHADGLASAQAILADREQSLRLRRSDRYEVHLYESVALRDGQHANNPWLQELPDPISKVTWGNYAALSTELAARLRVSEGDVLSIETDAGKVELPAFIQPGQEGRTISIALGYGRSLGGKVGAAVGANAYPLTHLRSGLRQYSAAEAIVRKTGRREPLASTQTHFSMEDRPIALETTLAEMRGSSGAAANEKEMDKEREPLPSLWPDQEAGQHTWGMAIDMNACTGCSACVIACQAENNVPVVGKDEVRRTRIMHWMRLDHYYTGSALSPQSIHQPMMCQHCGNAPCETVCPVLATTTSSEGLNQQVYNRCIGTRYCANNCPYKVRRFNFYNYSQMPDAPFDMDEPLARMVLNPDVAVRTRGVMEKCSLCVQRIQSAKNDARSGSRALADGDIQTACQQSCPSRAIVFGDLLDPASRVSLLRKDRRYYRVLEELGTRPNVGYLQKVRNPLTGI